ncbi:hypothetical protein V5O48_010693 [Marasmius crinis-equi]|uniref:Uncharacterized protein n=1 Tax=Marasmius crinis-equi TaxID=585013 RepID=A0ABR3F7P5_9AGAR
MPTQSPFTPPDHDAQRGHRPPNIRPSPYATSQSTPFESDAQLDLHILTAKRRLRTVKHELDNAIAERESEERIKELKLEVLDADLEYYEAKLDKKMVHIRARMEKEHVEKSFPVPEQGMPHTTTSRNVHMGSQPSSRTYSHETRALTPGNPPHCRVPQPIVKVIPTFTKNSAVTTGTLNTVPDYHIQSKRDDASKEQTLTFLVPDEQGHQLQISALSWIDTHHDVSPPGLPPLLSSLELTKRPVPALLNNPLAHQSCSRTPVRELVVNGGSPRDHTHSPPLSPTTTVSGNVSENDTTMTRTIVMAADSYTGLDHDNAPSELTLTFHGHVEQPCQSRTLAPSQTVVHHSVTTPAPIDSKPFIVPTLESKSIVPAPSLLHVLSASYPLSIVITARRNKSSSAYGCDYTRDGNGGLCVVSRHTCRGALPRTPPQGKPPWNYYPPAPPCSLQRAPLLHVWGYLSEVKSDVSLLPGNM